MNGAAIICAKSKKVYYNRPLPSDDVISVIKTARELKLQLSLYTVDDIYVEDIEHNANIHREIDNAVVKPADLQEVAQEQNIIKILFSSGDLYRHTEDLYRRFEETCTFYFSLPWFVEIVAQGVDKGDALQKLAVQLGIQRDEIMAIGDNFNDLPMLQYAGLGVAMGNAPSDIQVLADYVTCSHHDDGVAHAVEKFILKAGKSSPV